MQHYELSRTYGGAYKEVLQKRHYTCHILGGMEKKEKQANHKCLHPLSSKISGPEGFFWLGLRKQMMKLRDSILANFIREQLEAFLFAD